MRLPRFLAAAVSMVAFGAVAGVSQAAVPPDQHDPCATGGRDSCGTAGVGFYASSRYGVRWFGDFRGAVPGESPMFCLDLRFWYAARAYRYRALAGVGLRNRDGERVPLERQRRLAYAIWRYGRSSEPGRQAAVMLFVHTMMGDARPGELDPAVLGRRGAALYRRIVRDAARYHGPYRVEARLPEQLVVDRPAAATLRVVSARGYPLPYVRATLAAAGARILQAQVRTNRAGLARVRLTPTTAAGLRLQIATAPLAAPSPRVFVPTAALARRNGQRLAAPAARAVTAAVVRDDVRARPSLATIASAPVVRPGSRIFDRIRIRGLGQTPARIAVELFGPFPSRAAIRCRHPHLFWRGHVGTTGNGEVDSPAVAVARAGFYGFRERLIGTPLVAGTTTACATTGETTLVAPQIVTGRGDTATETTAPAAGRQTPVRIQVPALAIDAPLSPAAIDIAHGVLGIPADIHRAGWWRDGATPGRPRGTILVAGHVDSATAGAGAFYRLVHARPGQLIRLLTADRRRFSYRVDSIRSYRKSALPINLFAPTGPARLVLVTCGGPFDTTTGHYRNNIVVTAFPAT